MITDVCQRWNARAEVERVAALRRGHRNVASYSTRKAVAL